MLSIPIRASIDKSVLCWLATASAENVPNVSPKEVFTYFGDDLLLIANIASPQSVRNIQTNEQVCVSFIDILVQKGYQLKGKARIVPESDPDFAAMAAPLLHITQGHYPFSSLTCIRIEQVKPIIAPSYLLYPDTTEEAQIMAARKAYGFPGCRHCISEE